MKDLLTQLSLLGLRLTFGLQLALLHGWPKLQTFGAKVGSFPDPLHIGSRYSLMGAIAGELVCGALVALGAGTRFAALGMAFTMGVVVFGIHGADPWARREMAVLYLMGALAIAALGPGRFALDGVLFKRRGGAPAPKPFKAAARSA